MKRSELKQIVLEAMKGYSKYAQGGTTQGGTTDDFRNILTAIAKGRPEEGDPVRGNKILDKADPDNVARINRGEKPVYEGDGKLYSKEEVINYIENNPPAKYYRIATTSNSVQQAQSKEKAIEILDQSPIKQFELHRHGQVIQFSAPFDAGTAANAREMGLD
jgi:hypothetical protein